LRQVGIDQILLPATTVVAAAPFYRGEILGHVLESEPTPCSSTASAFDRRSERGGGARD
jgi:hypothetical protein